MGKVLDSKEDFGLTIWAQEFLTQGIVTVSPKFGLHAAPRGQRFGLGLVQVSASAASVPRSPRHLFPLLQGLYGGPLKGAYGSLNRRTEKTLNCGARICWSSNLGNAMKCETQKLEKKQTFETTGESRKIKGRS